MLCDSCGKKTSFTYICTGCGGRYCKDHRHPEDHKCVDAITEKPLEKKTESKLIEEQIELEPKVVHVTDFSISEASENIAVEMLEEEEIEENQAEEIEDEIKESNYRVFQEYKDFKSGRSKTSKYHRSSNLGKILQTLGKWIVVTGSFYVILYSLFKLLNFMTSFRI